MTSFSGASPGEMFSMASSSLATFASPSAFDRLMSAIMSLGEGNHRHAYLVGVRGVVRGSDGPFPRPLEGFLD
jgi:hypothetical protein